MEDFFLYSDYDRIWIRSTSEEIRQIKSICNSFNRITADIGDLEVINANGEYVEISFIGDAPKCRELQTMCGKYSFLNEIVPVYFGNSEWIGGAWVYHYLQYDLRIVGESEEDRDILQTASPLMQNALYSCYVNADKIILAFH